MPPKNHVKDFDPSIHLYSLLLFVSLIQSSIPSRQQNVTPLTPKSSPSPPASSIFLVTASTSSDIFGKLFNLLSVFDVSNGGISSGGVGTKEKIRAPDGSVMARGELAQERVEKSFKLNNYLLLSKLPMPTKGTSYGSLEIPRLTFSNQVKLGAGVNKISLLSVVVGLAVGAIWLSV